MLNVGVQGLLPGGSRRDCIGDIIATWIATKRITNSIPDQDRPAILPKATDEEGVGIEESELPTVIQWDGRS